MSPYTATHIMTIPTMQQRNATTEDDNDDYLSTLSNARLGQIVGISQTGVCPAANTDSKSRQVASRECINVIVRPIRRVSVR